MATTSTCTFRISNQLRNRLEQTARRIKRGKTSIITQALEEYLEKVDVSRFLEEARRQSILASRLSNEDENVWLDRAWTGGSPL